MADSARARPGRRVLARWAPIAGFLALILCGCATPPTPVINGFPAQPGRHAAALAPGRFTAAAGAPARPGGAPAAATAAPGTYAALARRALVALEREYYTGAGQWNLCVPARCGAGNRDWGADSLTYVLYLHWLLTRDPAVGTIMNALTATSPSAHSGVSDVPLWDSVAAAREYQVTGSPGALRKAETSFANVAGSRLYAPRQGMPHRSFSLLRDGIDLRDTPSPCGDTGSPPAARTSP